MTDLKRLDETLEDLNQALLLAENFHDGSRIMAERTAAAVAYPDFPSDEDVEIAARALYVGLFADDLGEDVPSVQLKLARAALQAIADARRTEEEG